MGEEKEQERRGHCILHGSQLNEVMTDVKDIKNMLLGNGAMLGIFGKVNIMWAVFLFVGAGIAIKIGTLIWTMWQS